MVVGDGPDAAACGGWPGRRCSFAGRVSDAEAARILASARALVVTATEEFGIAAVEAQAAGRPVIALREGGLRETVVDGVTGTFFDAPEPDALAEAVLAFDALARRPRGLRGERPPLRRRPVPPRPARGRRRALDGLGSRRAARRRPPRRSRGLARPV